MLISWGWSRGGIETISSGFWRIGIFEGVYGIEVI